MLLLGEALNRLEFTGVLCNESTLLKERGDILKLMMGGELVNISHESSMADSGERVLDPKGYMSVYDSGIQANVGDLLCLNVIVDVDVVKSFLDEVLLIVTL